MLYQQTSKSPYPAPDLLSSSDPPSCFPPDRRWTFSQPLATGTSKHGLIPALLVPVNVSTLRKPIGIPRCVLKSRRWRGPPPSRFPAKEAPCQMHHFCRVPRDASQTYKAPCVNGSRIPAAELPIKNHGVDLVPRRCPVVSESPGPDPGTAPPGQACHL